ncbi:hypothetical protein B0O99DRAFT_592876 [Bisporella sp. PMI_857]|nr:hypothetical protein B0O99DRAFT_592876 [Bisporella sp. PMI_857]
MRTIASLAENPVTQSEAVEKIRSLIQTIPPTHSNISSSTLSSPAETREAGKSDQIGILIYEDQNLSEANTSPSSFAQFSSINNNTSLNTVSQPNLSPSSSMSSKNKESEKVKGLPSSQFAPTLAPLPSPPFAIPSKSTETPQKTLRFPIWNGEGQSLGGSSYIDTSPAYTAISGNNLASGERHFNYNTIVNDSFRTLTTPSTNPLGTSVTAQESVPDISGEDSDEWHSEIGYEEKEVDIVTELDKSKQTETQKSLSEYPPMPSISTDETSLSSEGLPTASKATSASPMQNIPGLGKFNATRYSVEGQNQQQKSLDDTASLVPQKYPTGVDIQSRPIMRCRVNRFHGDLKTTKSIPLTTTNTPIPDPANNATSMFLQPAAVSNCDLKSLPSSESTFKAYKSLDTNQTHVAEARTPTGFLSDPPSTTVVNDDINESASAAEHPFGKPITSEQAAARISQSLNSNITKNSAGLLNTSNSMFTREKAKQMEAELIDAKEEIKDLYTMLQEAVEKAGWDEEYSADWEETGSRPLTAFIPNAAIELVRLENLRNDCIQKHHKITLHASQTQHELAQKDGQINRLQQQNAMAEAKAKDLEKTMNVMSEQLQQQKNELQILHSSDMEKAIQIQQLEKQVISLENRHKVVLLKNPECRSSSTNRIHSALRRKNKRLSRRLKCKNKKVCASNTNSQSWVEAVTNSNNEISAAADECQHPKVQNPELEIPSSELQKKFQRLKGEFEKISERLTKAEAAVPLKDNEIAALTERKLQIEEDKIELEHKSDKLMKTIKELDQERKHLKNRVGEQNIKIEEASERVILAENSLQESTIQNQVLESNFNALKDENIKLIKGESKFEGEKKSLEEEIARLNGNNSRLQSDKDSLVKERAGAESENNNLMGEFSKLQQENGRLQTENDTLAKDLKNLKFEVSTYQYKVDRLEQDENGVETFYITQKTTSDSEAHCEPYEVYPVTYIHGLLSESAIGLGIPMSDEIYAAQRIQGLAETIQKLNMQIHKLESKIPVKPISKPLRQRHHRQIMREPDMLDDEIVLSDTEVKDSYNIRRKIPCEKAEPGLEILDWEQLQQAGLIMSLAEACGKSNDAKPPKIGQHQSSSSKPITNGLSCTVKKSTSFTNLKIEAISRSTQTGWSLTQRNPDLVLCPVLNNNNSAYRENHPKQSESDPPAQEIAETANSSTTPDHINDSSELRTAIASTISNPKVKCWILLSSRPNSPRHATKNSIDSHNDSASPGWPQNSADIVVIPLFKSWLPSSTSPPPPREASRTITIHIQ